MSSVEMNPPIMSKIAVDSNIILYFLDSSQTIKREQSSKLLIQNPIINSQSLSEIINILSRRWKFPKTDVIQVVNKILEVSVYTCQ